MALRLGLVVMAVLAIASADRICDQFASVTTDRYFIQNNRWGSSATQCIETIGNSGFRIVQQDGWTSGGAPLSYPAVVFGCHYTNCSPGTNLPIQLSNVRSASSSISYSYAAGVYDAAYDIWLNPTYTIDGVNRQEIMIWFNRVGGIQPVGGVTGSVDISGVRWEVWQGNNGGNEVISYVAPYAIDNLTLNLVDFFNDCKNRGLFDDSWWLTSIQAGFEPWQQGVGLTVNSFSAQVN